MYVVVKVCRRKTVWTCGVNSRIDLFALWRFVSQALIYWSVHAGGETPVPIPNTVVKPSKADGSVLVRACESR
jgi:hypothetical protein